MTEVARLGALLDNAPPPVTAEQAEAMARDMFGLTATARMLSGERDHNFHLRDDAGQEFVLKVIHPAEDPGVTDFQSRALLHVAQAAPDLPTPRLIPPRNGAAIWTGPGQPPRRVRLLTYLQGRPLHTLPASPALRRHLGACLARLDLGLRDFRHPSDRHALLWDLQHAIQIRDLLAELPPDRTRLAHRFLDRFEAHVLPVLPGLRAQVVHNDFNPHNVLADPVDDGRIGGIIDFGDMVRAPLVQDIATAAAYQIAAQGPVLQGPAEMVAAFHAICPLTDAEIAILPELIATRLVLTIAISSWRAQRLPDNAAYILRNQPVAIAGLQRFDGLARCEAIDFLQQHCDQGMTP